MRCLIGWLCLVTLLVSCTPGTAEAVPAATPPPTATPEPLPDDLIYAVDPADGGFLSHVFAVDAHQPRIAFALETRMLPEVTLSHDGRFLYVADSYLSRVTRGEQHDAYSVYDAHTGRLLQADLPLPHRLLYKAVPHIGYPNFFLAADDSRLFVGRYGDPEIGRIRLSGVEPDTGEILFTAPYPPCDQMVQAWADRWLCLNGKANKAELVWVHPDETTQIETLFSFTDGGADRFALTANGRFLFVLGRGQPTEESAVPVWRFDLEAKTVWGEVGKVSLPRDLAVAWQGVALSPDASRLFVMLAPRPCCGLLFDGMWVFDTTSWEQAGTLTLSQPASHLAVSGDGETLYVVSPDAQQLSYYDANTLALEGVLEGLGERPFQLLIPK